MKKLCCLAVLLVLAATPRLRAQQTVTIDANAPTTPLPHFWEQMFGSGHAILSLHSAWRSDARAVKSVTDFRYVRFHGILDDEVGVFMRDDHGNPVYNWSQVDQIYDGLLKERHPSAGRDQLHAHIAGGQSLRRYRAMGSPVDPTLVQVKELNAETALSPPTVDHLTDGRLTLTLTPDALDLVTVDK